ncbi:targeting protein for Xklp2 [Diachasma alloeum]|uniref:targeting protein for Xklp2 n=1 Tax=Diachasma alloeum TaxID=454923 RepID=UPI0007381B69|nr:targeting protein for Xklp2 [Diachasma alloeum]
MYRNLKFDSPYAANAPMWSDFGSSPNVSSEYFEVLHPENETPFVAVPEKMRLNRSDFDSSPVINTQNALLAPPGSSQPDSTFMDAIDTINMTPVKVVSPKGKKNRRAEVIKETTVEDVLNNVIGIASTITKQQRRIVNLNKTQGAPSEKTPAKPRRATRSMHLVEGVKTATPLAKGPASNTRRSVAAQKLAAPVKPNDVVDSSVKNEAGVPISKIIRTPIFNYKKTVQDANSTPSTGISEPEMDKDETIKPEVVKNTALQPQQMEENYSKVTSSTPAAKPPATINLSRLRKSVLISNTSKQQTPTPTVPQQIQPQDEVRPAAPAPGPSEADHPEEDNDEDYEEIDQEAFEPVEDFDYYQVHHSRIVEKRRPRGTQPSVLTSHARRRSSILKIRRVSNQYVSLAEAIKKFEKGTPTRFHTVSAKNPKPKTLQVVKQQALKRTIPVSPALTSKNRVRRHVVLSQAELEEIELQKMKQHQIRANPVPTNILQGPQPLKSVPKKPLTSQKPFHLTKPKKTVSTKQGPTSSSSSSSGQNTQSKKPVKKIVPTVVSSEGGITIAESQIMHFGIPTTQKTQVIGSAKKKTTRPLPFNFEARNKLFMTKKEEKLKKLQSEEEQKAKVEFHARPMPLSAKKVALQPSKQVKNHADDHEDKQKPKVLPFSFEARDKVLMKKKEELRKKMEEEDKKARTFHANPAPHFKPVLVRGRSRENIKTDTDKNTGTVRNRSAENRKTDVKLQTRGRSVENLRTLTRDKSKETLKLPRTLQKQISTGQLSDQENRPPNYQPAVPKGKVPTKPSMPVLKPKLKSLPAELHSDKRARMRKDFDDQIRMKAALKEEKRRREQEERLAREQMEIKELRKKAETKARPMPVYKPMTLVKSTKQLTAPESPAWAKSKH